MGISGSAQLPRLPVRPNIQSSLPALAPRLPSRQRRSGDPSGLVRLTQAAAELWPRGRHCFDQVHRMLAQLCPRGACQVRVQKFDSFE